jgi:hypothetical protein
MKIVWNKVTWYSKTLALAIFIAFPFAFFYYGMQAGQLIALTNMTTPTSTPQTSVAMDYYSNPAEWQTDTNSAGGFTVAYPIDFNTTDNSSPKPATGWRINSTVSGRNYFTLVVPKAFEPQTNFSDATLTVGSSANNIAIKQCLDADPSGGPAVATSSAVINGISFTVFHTSDAGAGNFYETTSYRTLHAGQCYAVEYTIHSNQVANYPSSYNLREFNEAKATSLLDGIVDTFKFQ